MGGICKGAAPDAKHDAVLGKVRISHSGRYYVRGDERSSKPYANASRLAALESADEGSTIFEIKRHAGKGYTIAPWSVKKQALCTSRNNYENNDDYKKANMLLWLWEFVAGGNQYWNFIKDGDGWRIQNRHSGLFIGDDTGHLGGLIQTNLASSVLWTVQPYSPPPPPPPPPPARVLTVNGQPGEFLHGVRARAPRALLAVPQLLLAAADLGAGVEQVRILQDVQVRER